MKMLQKLRKNQKGFTLVEMIVVIVIIGILLAVLVPGIMKWIDKSKDAQIQTNARTAYLAASTALTEEYGKTNAKRPADVAALNALIATSDVDSTYPGEIKTVKYASETASDGIKYFTILEMTYEESGATATLKDGNWTVTRGTTTP